jgi:hypothetical protein
MSDVYCPNCQKELDFDLLNNVMDILADNQQECSFKCNNCRHDLKAYNSSGMYYIKNTNTNKDDLFIGAK